MIDLSQFVNQCVKVKLRNGDYVTTYVEKAHCPDEDAVYEYCVDHKSYTKQGKYYEHCDYEFDIVKITSLSNHNNKETKMTVTAPQLVVQRTFTVTLTPDQANRLVWIIQHQFAVHCGGDEIDNQLMELARQIERA